MAGELPTRLIYDGERYGTEADATASRLAVMDRYHEMVHADGPVLEDDLSMGTDEYTVQPRRRVRYERARARRLFFF